MKAAAFARHGGPEVLELTEFDLPEVGPGQVRVRVRAAGVQPIDCGVRRGMRPPWLTIAFPAIPGNEYAGVVDAIGDGVEGVAVGDEVLGFGAMGAYAEYITVDVEQITPKPAELPWEVAGGLTGAGQTAHIALEMLGVGETLLVHAAAGAVGTVAVQLAVRRGTRVIGTASPANHDYLRSLGAEPVAYGPGLADRLPDRVDAVLDGAGGEALDVSLGLVTDPAQIITLVDHGRAPALGVRTTQPLRSAARLAELAALVATGDLKILVRSTYPLAKAADAHRDVESGHGRGKVVLLV